MTTNKSTKYERNCKHIYLIQMIYMYECMYVLINIYTIFHILDAAFRTP